MVNFKLKAGDFLVNVNRGKDPWAVLRRWASGPYSHVFMYLGELSLKNKWSRYSLRPLAMLFESNGRGAVLQSLANRYGQEVVVMRPRAEDTQLRRILYQAIKLASEQKAYYDYLCIIRHVLPRPLLEILGLPIPLSWQRDSRQICSEACLEVCLRAGFPLLPADIVPLPGDFVTDGSLLRQVHSGVLCQEWL